MAGTDTTAQVGRPREFDHEAVLDTVVDLFWDRGFGATSMGDIVARTGLSKSSLYGAFGSKDALFETALDRYLADHRRTIDEILTNGSKGLDDIDVFFSGVEEQAGLTERRGCLAVNTATERRTTEPALVQMSARHRDAMRDGFTAALTRAVDLGVVDADQIDDLSNLLVTTALGLAVMIGGGAPTDEVLAHLASARASLRSGRGSAE
ncbi:MAG: TetR/AcrR family transcriptional regulator [Actinomycetota bacterium]